MKKLICCLLCIVLVVGCGTKVKGISADIEVGVFEITPQEFVDQWNAYIESVKKQSDDQKIQYLIPLPAHDADYTNVELVKGFEIRLAPDEKSGKLKSIEIEWYSWTLKDNAGIMTLGFMMGALPRFINPDSQLDLVRDLKIEAYGDNNFDSIIDGDCKYEISALNGLSSLIISPVQFGG